MRSFWLTVTGTMILVSLLMGFWLGAGLNVLAFTLWLGLGED